MRETIAVEGENNKRGTPGERGEVDRGEDIGGEGEIAQMKGEGRSKST